MRIKIVIMAAIDSGKKCFPLDVGVDFSILRCSLWQAKRAIYVRWAVYSEVNNLFAERIGHICVEG